MCGLWPWSKYVHAIAKGSGLKKAQGRICLICHNVFYSLGLPAKFDTLGAYWKHVTVPTNQHEHQKFLASHKMWIKLFNDNPSKVRIRSRSALEAAQTTQEVVSSKGARWKKPKKIFVLVESWDAEKYGKLDPEKIVTETVFDEVKKGVWMNAGKCGHFELEEFDERAFKERRIEDDGKDPFAEERQ